MTDEASEPRRAEPIGVVDTDHHAARPDSSAARVLVVIATYNEIENLPQLVETLRRSVPSADLLVIDDGSPDGTGRWCDERLALEPKLSVIHRAAKSGLGSATILGMRQAIDRGYDLVATMDADFSHPPERLPDLLAPLIADRSIDLAIGSRYVAGGRIEGWSWRRRWMSRWVNRFARLAMRMPVRDCSGAFRVYRVARLQQLPPEAVVARGYAYLEEILFRLVRQGARIVEVAYTFQDRRAGTTKIDAREAVAALLTITRFAILGVPRPEQQPPTSFRRPPS